MNADAIRLAELRETRRHNSAQEEAERVKAKAAMHGAIAKMADSAVRGASGVASVLAGKNDGAWGMTADPALDATYDQSYVQLDLETKRTPNGYKITAPICVINYFPVLGKVEGSTIDTTFLSMKRIYDIMRGKNRGATNYTVADVTKYIMPILSIAPCVAYIELLVKIATHPTLPKRITLKNIFSALGVDYTSFLADLPGIQEHLARMKAVLAEFPLPVELPVLKRWIWMTSFAFLDSPERNGSIFICRPNIYYDPQTSGPATLCTIANFTLGLAAPGSATTATAIHTTMDGMLNVLASILQDVTLQAVAGDILNAFEGRLINWGALALNAGDDPYYHDEEFCLELTNARFILNIAGIYYGALSIKLDNFGNVGQGCLNSTGRFQPLYGIVRDTYVTSGAYGQNGQVIFTDGHEGLSRELTNIAESWMHVYGTNQTSLTVYYWDPANPGQTISQNLTAGANQKYLALEAYGTEIMSYAQVIGYDAAGTETVRINQNSNECLNVTDVAYTNDFDHYFWRYMLTSNNEPYFVTTDLDSYGLIMNAALKNSIRVKNLALWGYATLNSVKSEKFSGSFNRPSQSTNKSHRPKFKDKMSASSSPDSK